MNERERGNSYVNCETREHVESDSVSERKREKTADR